MKILQLFAMTKWTEAEHEAFLEGLETWARRVEEDSGEICAHENRDTGRDARAEALHAHRETELQ